MKTKKRIVIVGATSAMAEHCARLWVAREAVDLILLGRNLLKTQQVAADLRVRSPQSTVTVIEADFMDAVLIRQQVDAIVNQAPVDLVLIAHGNLPDQGLCQSDLQACQAALMVNAISPVLFAEAFAGHMGYANAGTIAVIGSVAGDRGRKSNYVYGAAKGLVTRYVQGLQHRLAQSNVNIVLIKPGPTATPMTAKLQGQVGKLARVEEVSALIVTGIDQGKPVIYAPKKWALIMMVIRHLPAFIFNRMSI